MSTPSAWVASQVVPLNFPGHERQQPVTPSELRAALGQRMKVHLTWDVEVWCRPHQMNDAAFAAVFDRYVHGRWGGREWALPWALESLKAHGLRGTFFIEPLFSLRFGLDPLRKLVSLVMDAGQEVQLHLHPEWVKVASADALGRHIAPHQHLNQYPAQDQHDLLALGARLLQQAGAPAPTVFRAGSYACNADTLDALQRLGIALDCSINGFYDISAPDLPELRRDAGPWQRSGLLGLPVSNFVDGFGRPRPAQPSGVSASELIQAIEAAHRAGWTHFSLVMHNFDTLRADSSQPDTVVTRRIKRLFAHLDRHRERLPTATLADAEIDMGRLPRPWPAVKVGAMASTQRWAEQAWRRARGD